MDKNTFNEILKILPDDFGFKAVFEEPENEVSKDCEVLILGIGKHKNRTHQWQISPEK